jgi:TetR/AcrR family transcriptional repressor of mexJK operon
LSSAGLLKSADPGRVAEQFAYLVVGAPLDRAMLHGAMPTEDHVIAYARDGVETFLARYGTDHP